MLQSFVSDHDFRFLNTAVGENETDYFQYVFDTRYHKNRKAAQTGKVEFNFSADVPLGVYAFALDLPNTPNTFSCDGQKQFQLTK